MAVLPVHSETCNLWLADQAFELFISELKHRIGFILIRVAPLHVLAVADQLKELGYEAQLPIECMEEQPKALASRAHMERVINPENHFILIVNAKKGDIENYIGPNSFAEIAFGYYYHKNVFLLNDIYEPYRDELEGWDIIPLRGNLKHLNNFECPEAKDYLKAAVAIMLEFGKVSTNLLQRKLRIGYGRAASILDELEDKEFETKR